MDNYVFFLLNPTCCLLLRVFFPPHDLFYLLVLKVICCLLLSWWQNYKYQSLKVLRNNSNNYYPICSDGVGVAGENATQNYINN